MTNYKWEGRYQIDLPITAAADASREAEKQQLMDIKTTIHQLEKLQHDVGLAIDADVQIQVQKHSRNEVLWHGSFAKLFIPADTHFENPEEAPVLELSALIQEQRVLKLEQLSILKSREKYVQ